MESGRGGGEVSRVQRRDSYLHPPHSARDRGTTRARPDPEATLWGHLSANGIIANVLVD